MFSLRRSRPLFCLALLAWLAQLVLPAVHAVSMSGSHGNLAAWCGSLSPSLARQLAALPREVRDILMEGSQHQGDQDCVQACAAATQGSAPPPRIEWVLTSPDADLLAAPMPGGRIDAPHPVFLARGPPLQS